MHEKIEEGFMVFVADGEEGIGSVRAIFPDRSELIVYIENAGDFVVPLTEVSAVHSGKVILRADRLERGLLDTIGHAHDAEDPS